jgi:hypothetical protein
MKTMYAVVLALLSLSVIGCGPSAEQKKMVNNLTAEVKTMADNAKSSLGQLEGVAGEITAAVAGADTLAKKYPKQAAEITDAVNKLNAAKDRVMSVKDQVNKWLATFKVPDLASMDFDKVMAKLKEDKDQLTTAKSEIEGALSAATTALEGYKNLAASLMTKVEAKKK